MKHLESHAGIPQEYWKPLFYLSLISHSASLNTAVQQQQRHHISFRGCNSTSLAWFWFLIQPKPKASYLTQKVGQSHLISEGCANVLTMLETACKLLCSLFMFSFTSKFMLICSDIPNYIIV